MNKVEICQGWCKKCGICIAFYLCNLLEADDSSYPIVKTPEKCTGCILCEMRCPDFTIAVNKDEESREETGSTAGK